MFESNENDNFIIIKRLLMHILIMFESNENDKFIIIKRHFNNV
jgi:hypothetical protein